MKRRFSARLFLAALATAAVSACEPAYSTGRIREVDLPRGYVDVPADGSVVDGEILVAGWALAEDGIEDVAIYADGRYVDSAVLGGARPDVERAEAGREGAATSGFQVLLPAHRLPAGEVTLVVQARTRKGATRDLRAVPVYVPSP
ncbi:MAG: hypothetical protein KJ062_20370 [Thermoanaerobaculia bacterium]|nr:hypothetical protein [Thermoanaerobaculia bacterium]